jgi:hypothetical protein
VWVCASVCRACAQPMYVCKLKCVCVCVRTHTPMSMCVYLGVCAYTHPYACVPVHVHARGSPSVREHLLWAHDECVLKGVCSAA